MNTDQRTLDGTRERAILVLQDMLGLGGVPDTELAMHIWNKVNITSHENHTSRGNVIATGRELCNGCIHGMLIVRVRHEGVLCVSLGVWKSIHLNVANNDSLILSIHKRLSLRISSENHGCGSLHPW